MRQGSSEFGGVFAYAPPLQEFGNMLTRSIRNRIQNRDVKRICACCHLALVVCVYVRVCVYLRISVRVRMNACVTDPRAQTLYIQS